MENTNSITFKGACEEVTGIKIEISSYKDKILLDYGLVQGHRDVAYLKNKEFKDNPLDVKAVILSHSHLDHSGLLPSLNGNTPIFCTTPTYELCKHMLPDSQKVMTKDVEVIKRMFKRKHKKEIVEPLYSIEQVYNSLHNFKTVPYDMQIGLTEEFSFKLYDSCHILGSASVQVDLKTKKDIKKIFYTSDLGHDKSLLSDEPKTPLDITHLIIETTYGNKKRAKVDVNQRLLENVMKAYKRKGKLIIPAFSVQRMQSILLLLHKMYRENALPNMNVYLDSPLGLKVTHIYSKHLDKLNKDIIGYFERQGFDPFNFPALKFIDDPKQTEAISKSDESCIIISAAGMCEGGNVRTYLKDNIHKKETVVCFVGYNADNTLGRRIYESGGEVSIDGAKYRVRCATDYIEGFSAHADIDYLLCYIDSVNDNNELQKIYLVHGERESSINVRNELIKKGYPDSMLIIPETNKSYKL